MLAGWLLCLLFSSFAAGGVADRWFEEINNFSDDRFKSIANSERISLREEARKMFQFGYDSYMRYAFPEDELNPINCTGRGPDYDNPENINVNDALGGYSLTLIDALDTLAIMGNASEFRKAVGRVISEVSFDHSTEVQVFEATIRVLGGLLSSHLLIKDKSQTFGDLAPDGYSDELLHLARDLGARLLPAFDGTRTGIPYPRVDLQRGVYPGCLNCINETCTAGAGSLLVEFGVLTALTSDPTYYRAAYRALEALWRYRSNVTGLMGNEINIQTGQWVGTMSGVGAGLDSIFEYMLKSYILFADENLLTMFEESYESIKFHQRKGRHKCDEGEGNPPIYVNVRMTDGEMANTWVDALSAAWPGIQTLYGDIGEAMCQHLLHYSVWRKYGASPERYDWRNHRADVAFYPLRPELVESTYLLYRATRSPFYLHVGRDILSNLTTHAKARCGYATIHDVHDKSQEDRMESFFLSETCKYLFLLFDDENPLHSASFDHMFTTEGHVIPLSGAIRAAVQRSLLYEDSPSSPAHTARERASQYSCPKPPGVNGHQLPLRRKYMKQFEEALQI